MGAKIENLIAAWCSEPMGDYSCDLRSSSVQMLSGPVPVALARELGNLAAWRGCDPACLAGELLAAAMDDVLSALPDDVRTQIREAGIASQRLQAELRHETSWDPGGT